MSNTPQTIRAALSNTISKLEETSKLYETEKPNAPDLPPVFDDVAKALHPAQAALNAIKPIVRKPSEETSHVSRADTVAGRMETKAARLHAIFTRVLPDEGTTRMTRYRSVAKKDEAVETLMQDVLRDILDIAKGTTVSKEHITKVENVLHELGTIPPSLDEPSTKSFWNTGPGAQNIQDGNGDQYVNTGSGFQFSNSTFQAPFNFPGSVK